MRVLDLFCCQGGAATGYASLGAEVVGVDTDPQPRYPFTFVQGDALEYLTSHGHEFDMIHASPPCQRYSRITPDDKRHTHPDLIAPTRAALQAVGVPWVIENVEGARAHLVDPVKVCGSALGLGVRRHRLFESNVPLVGTQCAHKAQGTPVGVYGAGPYKREYLRPDGQRRGDKARSEAHASEALGGVGWMNWRGMAECIPPAYARFIGSQILPR